ncbi:hypothetical protein [Amycolatopsis minnesotensis]|uniref:Uncharacterized protein n=1 Tax=Amycolatopsis minnesotensis TaxID=337894 RepID=A0ABN2SYU5_9PSEU
MTVYGRDEQEWERLVEAARSFLVETAKLSRTTTYTELNAVLARRTGAMEFDFSLDRDRAALGHLLGCVVDRTYPSLGFMLSSLVQYLDANDAGPGFYALAQQLGLWKSGQSRERFWIEQLTASYGHYR